MKNRTCLVAVFCTAVLLTGCGKSGKTVKQIQKELAVRFFTLEKERLVRYRVFPGIVQPETQVNLSFRLSGQLIQFNAGAGKKVEKGELLAKLDPTMLQAAVDGAKAKYDEALRDYNRGKVLFEKQVLAAADFEKKKRDLDVAESAYRNAKDDLRDSELFAPFTGIVSNTYVDNFQQVKANDVLLKLQDLSSFQISVDIPEKEVARFPKSVSQANTDAEKAGGFYGTLPALPSKRFSLVLKEASTQADPVTQTFNVKFRILPQKIARLLPGTTMAVHVPDLNDFQNISGCDVPCDAVFPFDGKTCVWLIQENRHVVRVEVTVGRADHDTVSIYSPLLRAGMKIVSSGVYILAQNDLVRPLPENSNRQLTGEQL